MPCRYDPSPEEIAASRAAQVEAIKKPLEEQVEKTSRRLTDSQKQIAALEAVNNVLSVRLDYVQDLLWEVWNVALTHQANEDLKKRVKDVLAGQEIHRKNDIDRLVRTLSAAPTIDYEKLSKVLAADITKPLEPQLGFDPDSI